MTSRKSLQYFLTKSLADRDVHRQERIHQEQEKLKEHIIFCPAKFCKVYEVYRKQKKAEEAIDYTCCPPEIKKEVVVERDCPCVEISCRHQPPEGPGQGPTPLPVQPPHCGPIPTPPPPPLPCHPKHLHPPHLHPHPYPHHQPPPYLPPPHFHLPMGYAASPRPMAGGHFGGCPPRGGFGAHRLHPHARHQLQNVSHNRNNWQEQSIDDEMYNFNVDLPIPGAVCDMPSCVCPNAYAVPGAPPPLFGTSEGPKVVCPNKTTENLEEHFRKWSCPKPKKKKPRDMTPCVEEHDVIPLTASSIKRCVFGSKYDEPCCLEPKQGPDLLNISQNCPLNAECRAARSHQDEMFDMSSYRSPSAEDHSGAFFDGSQSSDPYLFYDAYDEDSLSRQSREYVQYANNYPFCAS